MGPTVPFSDPRQLRTLEAALERAPDDLAVRFERACCLEDLGHIAEAAQAYGDILQRESTHVGALTNLGSLHFERGLLVEAERYFGLAAAQDRTNPVALVNVGHLHAARGETEAAIASYTSALAGRPQLIQALLGLSRVFQATGDPERAQHYRDRAYAEPRMWRYPYRGATPPLHAAVLVSGLGGDVYSNRFFDDDVVERTIVLADSIRGDVRLPACNVIVNLIGDDDRCRPSLERARAIAQAATVQVINDPAAVLRTGRVEIMERLAALDGIRVPRTKRFSRAAVTADALRNEGFAFPMLLRAPGFHAGMHFEHVARDVDVRAVVHALPGPDVLAIEFIDLRGADRHVRKFRVASVDGRSYPVHLAVASHWKVHYFSADMADRADHRAEEAAFLADLEGFVGVRAMRGLEAIFATLGLDYAGVDFGIDASGTITVFEANANMGLYPANADPMWEYRRPAFDRIVRAFREMVVERAARSGYVPA